MSFQVSLLLNQSSEKENKMKDLTFLLEESRDKVNQLEEKTSKNLYKKMQQCVFCISFVMI